jgi:hypothetical protein
VEALRHQGNAFVEILNKHQEEKKKFSQVVDGLRELNAEERALNRTLYDTFEQRWGEMEQRMMSIRDQNILVSSNTWDVLIDDLSAL